MGGFSNYFDKFFHLTGNLQAYDAHNIYIQLLAECGIIGEFLFVLLFLTCLIKSIKLARKQLVRNDKKSMYILCYSIYVQIWFIIYGITGNPIFVASQCFIYISAIVMMLSVKMNEKHEVIKNEIMQ